MDVSFYQIFDTKKHLTTTELNITYTLSIHNATARPTRVKQTRVSPLILTGG